MNNETLPLSADSSFSSLVKTSSFSKPKVPDETLVSEKKIKDNEEKKEKKSEHVVTPLFLGKKGWKVKNSSSSSFKQMTIMKKKIKKKSHLFCCICRKTFSSYNSFVTHNNFHSGNFECSICKIRFDNSSSLKTHGFLHQFRKNNVVLNNNTTSIESAFPNDGSSSSNSSRKIKMECWFCRREFLKLESFNVHVSLHLNCF